jgi:CheY-like chemotaxis protein
MAHLLLVDDQEVFTRSLARNFKLKTGHTVDTANSAEDAKEKLLAGNYDLVISDYNMPGGDNGVELAQFIQQNKPGLRVIIASGDGENYIASKNPAYKSLISSGVIAGYCDKSADILRPMVEEVLAKMPPPLGVISNKMGGANQSV